jgi:hypothetical protein
MKLLDEIEIAIRLAFAEAVHACGKAANAAAVLQTNEPKISRLQNIENTERAASERAYLKAADVVRIDRLAGLPIMLNALAALEGCTVQSADRHAAPKGMPHHMSALAKEFGEAVREMADGADSIAKARRIRAELQDLANRVNDCISECDSVIAGEKLKVVS